MTDKDIGGEVMRIASDEPRFMYKTGNPLNNQRLSDLLHSSRCLIVIDSPNALWEDKEHKAVRNLDEEIKVYN